MSEQVFPTWAKHVLRGKCGAEIEMYFDDKVYARLPCSLEVHNNNNHATYDLGGALLAWTGKAPRGETPARVPMLIIQEEP